MKDILEKIKEIVSERTGVERTDIKPDSFFNDDLNVNELELSEIVSELEEVFNIELDIDLIDIKSIADLIHAIHDKIE
ncbi:MAG: phosphopantetheine-binding protein [Patescibacteria group bacterium]